MARTRLGSRFIGVLTLLTALALAEPSAFGDTISTPLMQYGYGLLSSNVAYAPDGTKFLTGSEDGKARLFDINTGALIRNFTGHTDDVTSVAFSPDGSKVLTGSWDSTAKLWDAATGTLIRTFTGHTDWISSVAFSPDGSKVITGSDDNTAKLWNAVTGALVRTFAGHTDDVISVAFSPDGTKVLTGSDDNTAKLWDADTGTEIRSFSHADGVRSVAFSPNGTKVLTGSWDGLARLWPTPIVGSIVINNNRTATKSPNVTLALTRSGGAGTGVARMRFSNDGATWSAWEDVAATKAWTLLEGTEGYKTVRVQFMDKLQNRSAVYNDYILLDTVTPTGGILINNGAATTTKPWVTLGLSWADTGSGMVRVRLSDNGSTWTAWIRCNPFYSHKLPAGSGYHTVRAQYSDAAGNYSPVYNDYIKVVAP